MTDATLTHLYFLLDRSGSMQSIKADTEGGFAAFIAEQRTGPGSLPRHAGTVRQRV